MGGANEICSDKTGTLTQNKMTVMGLFAMNAEQDITKDHQVEKLLQQCVLFNCSAHVEIENGKVVAKGNVTECGMINYLLKHNVPV